MFVNPEIEFSAWSSSTTRPSRSTFLLRGGGGASGGSGGGCSVRAIRGPCGDKGHLGAASPTSRLSTLGSASVTLGAAATLWKAPDDHLESEVPSTPSSNASVAAFLACLLLALCLCLSRMGAALFNRAFLAGPSPGGFAVRASS